MIYDVMLTEQAESDLRGIYEHIAFELLEPDYAKGQIDRLEKHILDLANFPKKYREYTEEPWKSRGMRMMSVDNYIVFYIPDDTTAIVTVNRVMYSARDFNKQL